jgi:hypothetical protein
MHLVPQIALNAISIITFRLLTTAHLQPNVSTHNQMLAIRVIQLFIIWLKQLALNVVTMA